ncbi:MAG TPA: hypothetical protein VF581_07765 [Flavobacterium sp.]|jgi:hypothetical protein
MEPLHDTYTDSGKLFSLSRVGKFLKSLATAIDKLPIVGGMVAPWLVAIVDIGDMFGPGAAQKITTDDLSPVEASLLSAWDQQKYTPFFTALATQVSNIFTTNLNADQQLALVNDCLKKMCAVRKHYSSLNDSFSPAAKQVRSEYIDKSFQALENLISKSILQYPQPLTRSTVFATSQSVNLSPLIASPAFASFSCSVYAIDRNVAAPTNGGINPPVLQPPGTAVESAANQDLILPSDSAPIGDASAAGESNNNLWIGLGMAAAIAVVLSRSKKKKSK